MPGGAPIGNHNATKNRPWRQAIDRALARRSKQSQTEALDALADKFLDAVETGDIQAMKEFGDRLDGKSKQQVELGSDQENPLRLVIEK